MESDKEKRDWVAILILVVGATLRLLLWFYNPPNNSYDDYMEPISYYINLAGRPNPAACWECYQPPFYFYVAEAIYKISFLLTGNYFMSWKSVQLLNSLVSIGTLLIIYKTLFKIFPKERNIVLLVLSIVCIYPRDLYTSAMISNDSLLVFFVCLSVYFFLLHWTNKSTNSLFSLCLSVLAASLTKQHGLITIILIAAVSARYILFHKVKTSQLLLTSPIVLPVLTSILSLGDEIWKYNLTGHFLVSNQHFFNYVNSQLPGSVDKIAFYSFDLPSLLKDPFLGPNTVYSYWTVLFASSWFDYEWRYSNPNLPAVKYIAGALYIFGVIILSLWIAGIIKALLKKKVPVKPTTALLLLVGLCFFLVPLVQTFRFPFYSSMKSLFFLPALSIMAITLVLGLKQFPWIQRAFVSYSLVGFTLFIGVTHVAYVIHYLSVALPELSGPLWVFPGLNL